MSEPQEVSTHLESTNVPIRCIQNVTRRHSLEYNGSIISSSVSEARTPRPLAADIEEEEEQTSERRIHFVCAHAVVPAHRPSFSDNIKSTFNKLFLVLSP